MLYLKIETKSTEKEKHFKLRKQRKETYNFRQNKIPLISFTSSASGSHIAIQTI